MPLHRMERMYGREGLPLARSTIYGWHHSEPAVTDPDVPAQCACRRRMQSCRPSPLRSPTTSWLIKSNLLLVTDNLTSPTVTLPVRFTLRRNA